MLLSSHILAEVEKTCDRVTIIRAGRVVESGALADLRHLARTSVTAELTGDAAAFASLQGIHTVLVEGSTLRCEVDAGSLTGLLEALAAAGVTSLVSQPPTLEELFRRYYGGATPGGQREPDPA